MTHMYSWRQHCGCMDREYKIEYIAERNTCNCKLLHKTQEIRYIIVLHWTHKVPHHQSQTFALSSDGKWGVLCV